MGPAAALSCRGSPRGSSSMTQQQYGKQNQSLSWLTVLVAHQCISSKLFFLSHILLQMFKPSYIQCFILFMPFLTFSSRSSYVFLMSQKKQIMIITSQTDTCTSNNHLSPHTIGSNTLNKSFSFGDLWVILMFIFNQIAKHNLKWRIWVCLLGH